MTIVLVAARILSFSVKIFHFFSSFFIFFRRHLRHFLLHGIPNYFSPRVSHHTSVLHCSSCEKVDGGRLVLEGAKPKWVPPRCQLIFDLKGEVKECKKEINSCLGAIAVDK
jgi:hypothetical protein